MAKIQVEGLLDPLKLPADCHTTIIVSSSTSSISWGRLRSVVKNLVRRG
jgi:hypothetical protein